MCFSVANVAQWTALAALGACAQARQNVSVDVLPGTYPNQLTADQEQLDVALLAPHSLEQVGRGCLEVSASTSFDVDAPTIPSQGDIEWRDEDGDGVRDAVASFSVASLRDAGLLGAGTTHLAVRATTCDGTVLTGSDRLFDAGVPLVPLLPPSGAEAVGTIQLPLFDDSRPGPSADGRELLLRIWYPAAPTGAEPASYFLDAREADLNAASSGLPAGIFDLVHGWSILGTEPASDRRPTLLLSTGLGVPLTFYSGIAEELGSLGYVVIGLAHPDGSGIVAYPDGTTSEVDPNVQPEESERTAIVRGWADDLKFVANWLANDAAEASLDPVSHAVLGLVDLSRLGVFGHSFGGAAAVWAASETPLFPAAANMDGRLWGDVLERGSTKPVLLLLSEGASPELDASIAEFTNHTLAPVHSARVSGSLHNDFSDSAVLIPGLAQLDPRVQPADYQVGPIEPGRVLAIESAYLRALFESAWSGDASALLSGETAEFPEVSATTSLSP